MTFYFILINNWFEDDLIGFKMIKLPINEVIQLKMKRSCFYLDTDDRVHVDARQMPGLYHGDADLIVLGCEAVKTPPTSARTTGWYI